MFLVLTPRLHSCRFGVVSVFYCLGVEGAVFKDTNSSVNFSLENMFQFLTQFHFFNCELWDLFNAMLAKADPTGVHVDGDPMNEQKIQNFHFLTRYHPRVTKCLHFFKWYIDEERLREDGSLGRGDLADVLGLFTNDEHVRKAALAMDIHPRLGARSLLCGLDNDLLKVIASFM